MGMSAYAGLVLCLATVPLLIQDRAPNPPPPVGTSRISGQVVAADNGVPLTTRPRGGGQFPAWTQVTDDAGRFDFGDLPAGVYSIMVTPRSGFVRPQPRQAEVED